MLAAAGLTFVRFPRCLSNADDLAQRNTLESIFRLCVHLRNLLLCQCHCFLLLRTIQSHILNPLLWMVRSSPVARFQKLGMRLFPRCNSNGSSHWIEIISINSVFNIQNYCLTIYENIFKTRRGQESGTNLVNRQMWPRRKESQDVFVTTKKSTILSVGSSARNSAMSQCHAVSPYLIDFEVGRSFFKQRK